MPYKRADDTGFVDARGLAAARKQRLAERAKIALAAVSLRAAPQFEDRPAALRNAGEQVAEEGVGHVGQPVPWQWSFAIAHRPEIEESRA